MKMVKPQPKPHVPHPHMGDLAIHPKGSKAMRSGVGNQHLRVSVPRVRKGQ
jgi:hypothetical protein